MLIHAMADTVFPKIVPITGVIVVVCLLHITKAFVSVAVLVEIVTISVHRKPLAVDIDRSIIILRSGICC